MKETCEYPLLQNLESNTILNAPTTYTARGFRKIPGHPAPYERCNL
ncbi:MAG: hypothetical protein WKI04_18105 [Ferruginibacter sp.]